MCEANRRNYLNMEIWGIWRFWANMALVYWVGVYEDLVVYMERVIINFKSRELVTCGFCLRKGIEVIRP